MISMGNYDTYTHKKERYEGKGVTPITCTIQFVEDNKIVYTNTFPIPKSRESALGLILSKIENYIQKRVEEGDPLGNYVINVRFYKVPKEVKAFYDLSPLRKFISLLKGERVPLGIVYVVNALKRNYGDKIRIKLEYE